MIVVMEAGASPEVIEAVEARIRAAGLGVHVSRGAERTLVGAIGDERVLEPEHFESMPGVERAMHIVKPYKLVSREWHPGRTVVDVSGTAIGGDEVQVIAGPCSVETDEQMAAAADAVARGGARMMRGGAFKPRSSPYAFQGLGEEALRRRSERRRKASDPPPAYGAGPGGLPTAECSVLHAELVKLGPRLEAQAASNERLTTSVDALVKRFDRHLSYQEGLEVGRATGTHPKVVR